MTFLILFMALMQQPVQPQPLTKQPVKPTPNSSLVIGKNVTHTHQLWLSYNTPGPAGPKAQGRKLPK